MGGRNLTQGDQGNFDKGIVRMTFVVNVGANGALTLQQWNAGAGPSALTYTAAPTTGAMPGFRGVKSVARSAVTAGLWTIVLQNPYQRILNYNVVFSLVSGLPAAPIAALVNGFSGSGPGVGVNNRTTPQFQLQMQNTSGVATDPASGEQALVTLELQDSTAP